MERLQRARQAHGQRDWVRAREHLHAARQDAALDAESLSILADSAWWLGLIDEALEVQEQAYRAHLAEGRPRRAALAALELAYTLALRGAPARASGWMGRGVRLLEAEPPCAERSYLDYFAHEEAFAAQRLERAHRLAVQVQRAGDRFGDPNLVALGVAGQGRVLIRRGQVPAGMTLMDEAMVAAASDELDPGWAGNIYCHMMSACHAIADWSRAGEWTEATRSWCERMPGAGPFLGICRVHRIQTLGVLGAWEEAEREAERVCGDPVVFVVATVAEAHYQLGELRRRRGDAPGAEVAFGRAHALGRDPQPGAALLRLGEGRTAAAQSAIDRALAGAGSDPLARAPLLPAAVEIALGTGADGAAGLVSELETIAERFGTEALAADAATAAAMGAVAEGRGEDAAAAARRAVAAWGRLGAPYETARARLLLAAACRLCGDEDGAAQEAAAAGAALAALGVPPEVAAPAAGRLGAGGAGDPRGRRPDGLSRRELEILALVAAGRSNQEIAALLVLSVRTVERHLATVYRKIGVRGRTARAAAVGYALRNGLAGPQG